MAIRFHSILRLAVRRFSPAFVRVSRGAACRICQHTVATGLKGGYQVVTRDLNHDGRPDLIALASGMAELVWFENPTWERHGRWRIYAYDQLRRMGYKRRRHPGNHAGRRIYKPGKQQHRYCFIARA